MTTDNWLELSRIIVDFVKSLLPYTFLIIMFWIYRKEIKNLIDKGSLKLSVPGLNLETAQNQQDELTSKDKKEIEKLNSELENAKLIEKKLHELQEYTVRDKDTFFLGYHFEKTYRLLFPSQMAVLNILNTQDATLDEARASELFRRTIWSQTFNLQFEQFMNFMITSGLIRFDPNQRKYFLEPIGKAFWEYIKRENMSLKIPANDFIN